MRTDIVSSNGRGSGVMMSVTKSMNPVGMNTISVAGIETLVVRLILHDSSCLHLLWSTEHQLQNWRF